MMIKKLPKQYFRQNNITQNKAQTKPNDILDLCTAQIKTKTKVLVQLAKKTFLLLSPSLKNKGYIIYKLSKEVSICICKFVFVVL